jgi:hypothetical protein
MVRSNMTRTEAITIITKALHTVDDTTLEAAAAHIAHVATPGLTAGDIQAAFATESVLPRALSAHELALVEQSKEDFRLGRTLSLAELEASLNARAAIRAARRA